MSEAQRMRRHERSPAHREVQFSIPGNGINGSGRIKDYSHEGIRFVSERALNPGTTIALRIASVGIRIAPLRISATVVRCSRQLETGDHSIACALD